MNTTGSPETHNLRIDVILADPGLDAASPTRLLVMGMDSVSADIMSSLPGLRLWKKFTHTSHHSSHAKLYISESALAVLCISEGCDINPDPVFASEIIHDVMISCREVLVLRLMHKNNEPCAWSLITSTNHELNPHFCEFTRCSCGEVVRGFSAQLFNYCELRRFKCNVIICTISAAANIAEFYLKLAVMLEDFIGYHVNWLFPDSYSFSQSKRPSELLFT